MVAFRKPRRERRLLARRRHAYIHISNLLRVKIR